MDKSQAQIKNFFRASAEDFKKIPGSPIAYWVNPKFFNIFITGTKIDQIAPPRIGMMTTNNERFLRFWFEIEHHLIGFNFLNIQQASKSEIKWFPYNKGGKFRKWAGNSELVVNWYKGGAEISASGMKSFRGKGFYFHEGITWGDVSSAIFSCRYTSNGKMFDIKGTSAFPAEQDIPIVMSILNSKVGSYILKFLNPTISFQSGDIRRVPIPYKSIYNCLIDKDIHRLIEEAQSDWDSYETSWDFAALPLLLHDYKNETVISTYTSLRSYWQNTTLEMHRLEEENNRIFIEAYGLEDELTPDVPLKEITLTCNPYYRYGVDADGSVEKGVFPINQTIEDRLKADTMKEFISYAVGCMFGRYSIDKEGLVLANAGDGIEQYMKMSPDPSFKPDESGILPLTDADDFNDDLPTQFYRFLRITFGEEHYHENLRFIEDSIGKTVRQYFLKDFFKDHVQRYKKRPIYWLVTSPKGSFRAFIYLHRYTKDTVGQVLNDYVRPFEKKLESKIAGCRQIDSSVAAGTKEKIQAQRDVDRFEKALQEISEWDANVLRPLALKRAELDLDDGVKVNYAKLGDVLEKVVGLNG